MSIYVLPPFLGTSPVMKSQTDGSHSYTSSALQDMPDNTSSYPARAGVCNSNSCNKDPLESGVFFPKRADDQALLAVDPAGKD